MRLFAGLIAAAVSAAAASSPYARVEPVPLASVRMHEGFWTPRREINARVSLPSLLKEFEDRGIIDNFRRISGKKKAARKGPLYTDSDVYKWMEAVSWQIATGDDPALRKMLDPVIDEVLAAQEPSGYINTYYSAERASERHTNMRHGHELYCGGHLIQAGIAHFRATKDRRLLDAGARFADYVIANFGRNKKPIIEGHPEFELALVELYRTTGDKRYLEYARYMLESEPDRIPLPERDLVYLYTGMPYTSRTQFEGHAVRAMYASAGAADYYLETGDKAYWSTMQRLWDDMARTKMYITGGVGSRAQGEAFGEAYELPNQLAYTESCAAIANMMWNWRLLLATGDARYADVVERALYNGVNSGVSLSGNLYCYRNPLELTGNPADKIRNPWYDTTCCPPNLQRIFASLPGYLYGMSKEGPYVHLYHPSELRWGNNRITQETQYPWKGEVTLKVDAQGTFALRLRIPAWSRSTSVDVNGTAVTAEPGTYLEIKRNWKPGDVVKLRLDVRPRFTAANPRVRDNVGKVAVERGPLVYAMEGVDQTAPVWESAVRVGQQINETFQPDLLGGVVRVTAPALVRPSSSALYEELRPRSGTTAEVHLVPYYTFANRESTPMQVWIPYVN